MSNISLDLFIPLPTSPASGSSKKSKKGKAVVSSQLLPSLLASLPQRSVVALTTIIHGSSLPPTPEPRKAGDYPLLNRFKLLRKQKKVVPDVAVFSRLHSVIASANECPTFSEEINGWDLVSLQPTNTSALLASLSTSAHLITIQVPTPYRLPSQLYESRKPLELLYAPILKDISLLPAFTSTLSHLLQSTRHLRPRTPIVLSSGSSDLMMHRKRDDLKNFLISACGISCDDAEWCLNGLSVLGDVKGLVTCDEVTNVDADKGDKEVEKGDDVLGAHVSREKGYDGVSEEEVERNTKRVKVDDEPAPAADEDGFLMLGSMSDSSSDSEDNE